MTTAWVLSGGASHGAVQVGMLRALIEVGVTPAAIYATSVGAVNGAAVARRPDRAALDELLRQWVAFGIDPPIRFSLRRQLVAVVRRQTALSSLEPLRGLLNEAFGAAADIGRLAVPLGVTATNLATGIERLFRSGPLVETVVASCSVPGLFPPTPLDGVPHVDGLLYGAPVRQALLDGHTCVYVLATNSDLSGAPLPTTWYSLAKRAATMVMWNQLTGAHDGPLAGTRVHLLPIPPSLGTVARWDFSRSQQLHDEGYALTAAWLSRQPA